MKKIIVNNDNIEKQQIEEIADIIKNGGLIIYPTDTVYGMGCNACDQSAVDHLFEVKGRKDENKVSVMVDSVDTIKKYANVGLLEEKYILEYLPGAVTVILKIKDNFAKEGHFARQVVNDDSAVGFRVIDKFRFLPEIIRKTGCPLVTTSANLSNAGVIGANIDYVKNQLEKVWDQISVVIDAGDLGNRLPSTVVDMTKTPFTILRQGVKEITISEKN